MMRARSAASALLVILAISAIGAVPAQAGVVAVRHVEGVTRGLLVLRGPDGTILADGDLVQEVRDGRVDSRLTLRFRDGSLHDETVTFSQQRVFTLLSYRLRQRGPIFPVQIDVRLDRDTGHYEVRSRRGERDEEAVTGKADLPPDLYNGMLIILLKNLVRDVGETVQLLVFTPTPIRIQLEMTPLGDETVLAGDRRLSATRYVVKPKLGLLRGAAAAILGKTPADYHCWIVRAGAPAFVAIDGPLYPGGPVWRIETVGPRAPARPAS